MDLRKYTRIMNFVHIAACSNAQIGGCSWIVYRSQVFDSNYHYIADFRHNVSDFFMLHLDEEIYLTPDRALHSICDVDY